MVTSVTPVLEQQHMPRAQAHAVGQDVHVRFDFGAYMDSSTSITQLANETLDQSHVAARNRAGEYCCNQQYSVTAITTSTGTIAERYAYTAYGQPTILDAPGSILNASAISNRYTYTGREWDATLGLHHFRARWMSPSAGRFLGRDPIGYVGSQWNLLEYVASSALNRGDPFGLCAAAPEPRTDEECCEAARKEKNVHQNDIGGVVCCDGKKVSCVFVSGGSYAPKSKDAQKIIDRCTIVHEDVHKDDSDECKEEIPSLYRDPRAPGVDRNRAECDAYTAERACLENGIDECTTAECRREVQQEIDHVLRRLRQYCKQGRSGFDPGSGFGPRSGWPSGPAMPRSGW